MKKLSCLLVFVLMVLSLFVSCNDQAKVAEVQFDSDGGGAVDSILVEIGKTIPEPKSPVKDGYVFVEWQLDGKTFSFDTPIKSNIVLKAVWREASEQEPQKFLMAVATINKDEVCLDYGTKDTLGITRAVIKDSLIDEQGKVAREESYELKCDSGFDELAFKLKYFGIHNLDIEFYNANNSQVAYSEFTVTTISDHYNIVMMNATLPVTHVSLELVGSLKGQNNIVALERAGSFSWDSLPDGTVDCPFAEKEKIEGSVVSGNNYFFELCDAMDRYVKYLHDLDEDSTFSLYITDNYPELILKLLYDNGISEDKCNIFMVTDGTGTYSIFAQTFPNSLTDAELEAKFVEMSNDWAGWKTKAKGQDYSYLNDIATKVGRTYQMLQDYPAVIVQDENVEWWLGRKNVDVMTCAYIFNTYLSSLSRVKARNLNSSLTALDKESQEDLKGFLHFNENMFAEASEKDKKVMLFIGTRYDVTESYHLSDYLTFIKEYFGDDYVYYYKGHPGDPTDINPTRKTLLDKLGVTDVESSIAAELIYFFNPGIDLCGYPSSTYNIVPDDYEIPFIMYSGTQNNSAFNGQEYKMNVNKTIGFDSDNTYKILFEKGCSISEDIAYGIWKKTEVPFTVHYYNAGGIEVVK